ncbi:bifunctional DNA primase/polymerase [Corynebacterium glucuronolyticum]
MGLHALGYTEWGLEVLPLGGKAPYTRRGVYDATTNQDLIEQWWRQWPNANIGVRVPAGCLVVDVDPRNGGTADFKRLFPNNSCPATGRTFTGGGGLHVWFTLPYSGDLNGHYGAGIDLKTHRGYVVAPPSIHPQTGREYRWGPFMPPERWAPLPQWCLKDVYKPTTPPARREPIAIRRWRAKHTGTPGVGLIRAVGEATPGSRNSLLYWAACRAVEDGLTIEAELIEAATLAGLSEVEATRTVASARRAGAVA